MELLAPRSRRKLARTYSHHAIPTVAQSRLAGLYEEYAEIAARHGAAPRTSRNILTASRELLEYLFENNAPVRAAEAVPVAR